MPTKTLSRREEEIIALCEEGMTNDGIAHRLGISIGTVNTYWIRIRLKVGGFGRTDTVARIVKDRATKEHEMLLQMLAENEKLLLQQRATLALLDLATNKSGSTVWATDNALNIAMIANGKMPSKISGVKWEVGKSVYEIFRTTDPNDQAVAAHLGALSGKPESVRLQSMFSNMILRTSPVYDDAKIITGCVSMLDVISDDYGQISLAA